jgi:hypothetical protein
MLTELCQIILKVTLDRLDRAHHSLVKLVAVRLAEA